jgi:hypothetical protein
MGGRGEFGGKIGGEEMRPEARRWDRKVGGIMMLMRMAEIC